MSMLLRRTTAVLAALALCSAGAVADTIYTTDGRTLDEIEILNETLQNVIYKAKGKSGEQSVPSDQVLSVKYTNKLPRLVDTAEGDIGDGNFDAAAAGFEQFADGVVSGENKKDKQLWAPGYAYYRAIETNQSINSKESIGRVIEVADKLISKCPESRYVPLAFVAKSAALRDLGKGKEAGEAIAGLKELVKTKALSDAYRLQAELIEVEIGSLKGQQKRDRLIEIGTQAGSSYPIVRNRARVLEAETYLEGENKDFGKARKIYEAVIKDPKADAATLAGAHSGMGDCLFQEAADKMRSGTDASATLKEAVLNYLRVVVSYKNQPRYVPKAMYQAGKVFEFMGEENKPNARRMYRDLIRQYPGSEWAAAAKNAR